MPKKRKIDLKREEAIHIALEAQGLARENSFGKGKSGVLESIRHLGYIQLDTLAVVARAHHHTLWTRTNEYTGNHLNELMTEKKIFEYWGHAAAYLPMNDFRFSLVRKNEFLKGRAHWFAKDKKIHRYVFDKIKAEGPLQSKDFETDTKRGSWWDWKPAKIALEQLFQEGSLMIKERKGFQKVYDLTERVLPSEIETSLPTKEEFANYLIRSAIRSNGVASLKDMTHLRKGILPSVEKMLKKMMLAGEVSEVSIESVNDIYYQFPADGYRDSQLSKVNSKSVSILSPFDNVVIRRQRLKDIFDYDFTLECYLPAHKRKFGYFCLPVLFENKFVGKFDSKADRATSTFYVKSLYLESQPKSKDEFLVAFATTLKMFAEFNGCDKIIVEKTFPVKIKSELKKFLK